MRRDGSISWLYSLIFWNFIKEEHAPITITKIRLFKYIEILQPKNENFQIKIMIIFFPISAQNIDEAV